MITVDGKWTMEGLDRSDERRIKTAESLSAYINTVGLLPFFKGVKLTFPRKGGVL